MTTPLRSAASLVNGHGILLPTRNDTRPLALAYAPAGTRALRFSPSHVAAIAGDAELARLSLNPQHLQAAARSPSGGDGAAGFRFEPAWFPTGKVTRLGLIDHNPIAQYEAHPDK